MKNILKYGILMAGIITAIILTPLALWIVLTEPAPSNQILRWLFPIVIGQFAAILLLVALILEYKTLMSTYEDKMNIAKTQMVAILADLDEIIVAIEKKQKSDKLTPPVADQRTGSSNKSDREIL